MNAGREPRYFEALLATRSSPYDLVSLVLAVRFSFQISAQTSVTLRKVGDFLVNQGRNAQSDTYQNDIYL